MTAPLKKEKVYCKKCEYFFRKPNDMYYMNSDAYPSPNPIPLSCRNGTYKWHVECHYLDNQKEHVEYVECYDEVRERRYKDVKSPRTLNYNNDCFWFKKKKEEDEPDWEK
jgi:hypothetical protein